MRQDEYKMFLLSMKFITQNLQYQSDSVQEKTKRLQQSDCALISQLRQCDGKKLL